VIAARWWAKVHPTMLRRYRDIRVL
jgi:hypothetical protein